MLEKRDLSKTSPIEQYSFTNYKTNSQDKPLDKTKNSNTFTFNFGNYLNYEYENSLGIMTNLKTCESDNGNSKCLVNG